MPDGEVPEEEVQEGMPDGAPMDDNPDPDAMDQMDDPGDEPATISPTAQAFAKQKKTKNSFIVPKEVVTRQAMIEYVSLQWWSREGCATCPFVSLLWLVLLAHISLNSHTEASFGLRDAFTGHVNGIGALPTLGVAAAEVPQEDVVNGTYCKCSCAPQGYDLCNPVSGLVSRFEGNVNMQQLAMLRARSAYFFAHEEASPLLLSDLRTIADVWFWIQHGLVPDFWKEEGRDAALYTNVLFQKSGVESSIGLTPGIMLHWTQIIGGIRMRQKRLQNADCDINSDIADRYTTSCHNDELLTKPFSIGVASYAPGFNPSTESYGSFDVYLDMGRPAHIVLEIIEHMLKAYGWLDDGTKSLQLQAAFINAESSPPLFGLLEVRFDFEGSGSITRTVNVYTTAADEFPTQLHLFLELAWVALVGWLLVRLLYQACRHCYRAASRALDPDFASNSGKPKETSGCDVWEALDWGTLFLSVALLVNRLLMTRETISVSEKIARLPNAPDFGESEKTVTNYHAQWGDVLDNIEQLVYWRDYNRLAVFWYTICLTFQFFKLLRGQPKLAQLAFSIMHAWEDLLHFVCVFLVMYLNFAFGGYMIFGLVLEAWSTPAKAINTSFLALFGDMDLIAMYEVAPISTVLWAVLFVSSMIFVMINLLLAITFEHYTIVKARAGSVTGIWTQFRAMVRDQKNRVWERGCCGILCCCCRRDPSVPDHRPLLDELMRRAAFSEEERRGIRKSALGPKWYGRDREKFLFAGASSDFDAMGAGQQDVTQDFNDLGVDKEYRDALLEECKANSKREYDVEETKVIQLRQLVTIAEQDIAGMRQRLENCQDMAKTSMSDLSRRLASLEKLVHASLTELVIIAASAGVPDKKEPKSLAQRAQLDSTVSSLRGLSASDKSQAMLTGSISHVLKKLSQGEPERRPDDVNTWHRAAKVVDTRGKRSMPQSTWSNGFFKK